MQLSDFEYELPPALIAQYPTPERTASRLLEVGAGGLHDRRFEDVQHLVHPGDLLVVNDTRVIKARLFAQKDSGGQAEILMERLLDSHEALCQVRVSKALRPGRTLRVGDDTLTCLGRDGQFYRLRSVRTWLELLDCHGHVPLPPYIERGDIERADIERADDAALDAERYQTVYGEVPGAVAAPTAGLHFSKALLERMVASGVQLARITLHVGAGTFQPVRGDLANHQMHEEYYSVSEEAAGQIAAARAAGGRIVAVGTTVVRTLESAAIAGRGQVLPGEATTRLFIKPGFEFQVVDALITNFHLPGSTLLMLVCAFAGYDRVIHAYEDAVSKGYRFFSYGDAMWLERSDV